MTTTVHIADNPSVTVTEEVVDPRPPDRIGFVAEGVIRPSKALLGRFEGSSLTPSRVGISVGPSRTVEVDLDETSSLRLESVDVGVETPDAGDVARELESIGSPGDDAADAAAGAIAFTVEGSIRDLPEETLEAIADGSPSLESVTFSVTETTESDGGSPVDVLLDVDLFGFGVVVRRNGTIEVRSRGSATGSGLL